MIRISKAVFVAVLLGLFAPVIANASSHKSYSRAVKNASASVVNVYSGKTARATMQANLSRGSKRRKITLGSGVIMNRRGYILTNYHVIRRMSKVMIALMDGRKVQAKVVGVDPETDLAVLHISLDNISPIKLGNSNNVEVGDIVLAIGNPFGLGQTVTQGIVSAIGRNTVGLNSLENYIQTDAAINPGNSGGALVNTNGHLVGINTGIYTRSGGYQGVGFAIPVDNALNVMQQIIKSGKVTRGWLGVEVVTLDARTAKALGVKQTRGVVVDDVIPNSPASKAGIKRLDVVLSVNNRSIRNARGFQGAVAQRKPGDVIQLTVSRKGVRRAFSARLSKIPRRPILDDRASPEDRGTLQGPADDR
ncbi:MAG: trypsin-like peptidase domain-containing protein [Gammaproteobacteria bacterium]|nr:trypsin-like peptidase domain-containing protein [Gammaproteobacteria bacterium]MCH9743820.1 trypsin-like peptidase domain-containing protein [Gammaproteobacteria bacterium]